MTLPPLRLAAPGVFYPVGRGLALRREDLAPVLEAARAHPKGRARLCAHPGPEADLHEMFIVLARGGYVRPHRHLNRPESFLVLEGRARVLCFDGTGRPTACHELGDAASGRSFFFRMEDPVFHTVIVDSPQLLVVETTRGPFDPGTTEAAPWAPDEGDLGAGAAFIAKALAVWGGRP
ncbi:MAG: cupin fold metalloprotein, WbuC family [Acidobacteria bacterium]|nr:cupin fold metalloprotein, WbuC family [Acidobacteriota bacterium]